MISIEGSTTINNQLYKFDNDTWKIKKTLQWYHGMTSWCMTTSWQLDDDIALRTTYIRYHGMTMAWHHIPDIMAWHHISWQYHDNIITISWCYTLSLLDKIGYQKIPDTMQPKIQSMQQIVEPKGGSKMSFQVKTDCKL